MRPSFLTPDQVRAVLLAAGGTRYAPLFTLLVNTGLRRGEAMALHWSDVDLEAGTLRVRGTLPRVNGKLEVTEPKTAKSRRAVPLSELPCGLPCEPRNTLWAFNAAAKRAGLPGARWACTRCATLQPQ
jgi:integrase